MHGDTEVIGERELKLARQAAMSAYMAGKARAQYALVELDDMVGEANLWLAYNVARIAKWREEDDTHCDNRIRYACRMHCLRIVAEERLRRSKAERSDAHYYNMATVREILPDIFDQEDWYGQSVVSDGPKRPTAPSEGNNRLAMIVDVKAAFEALDGEDQMILESRFRNGGVNYDELGESLEISARTARRREDRAVSRLIERLGGDYPW